MSDWHDLENGIHAALNVITGVRVWRNARGFDKRAHISYGLGEGSADFIGIAFGKPFAIEAKHMSGRANLAQRAWMKNWLALGGRGGIAKTVEEAVTLAMACKEE